MRLKRITGYALIYLCAGLDRIPWREDGRWYLYGDRGCMLGLATQGFKLLLEDEEEQGEDE